MRAIGRAHLFENRAASGHDLRDPEGAANLNQLAARDDHFLATRERVERQEDGRGVVINDRGRFGAGEIDEKLFDHLLTPSPLPESQVVFEVDGTGAGAANRLDGRLREQRPAQIRVEDGSGGVHDSREPEVPRRVDRGFEPVEDGLLAKRAWLERVSLSNLASQLVEDLSALAKDVCPAESSQQGLRSRVREETVHGRQFAERITSH